MIRLAMRGAAALVVIVWAWFMTVAGHVLWYSTPKFSASPEGVWKHYEYITLQSLLLLAVTGCAAVLFGILWSGKPVQEWLDGGQGE